MELHIKDRLYLPQVLPAQNSFKDFSLKKSIIEKVRFSNEEKEKFKMKEDAEHQKITWDQKLDNEAPLNVEFTKEEIEYLKKGCEALVEAPYPDDFWVTVEKIYNASF